LENLGAGRRFIAERAAPDALFEPVHHLRRKTVRVDGEGPVQVNTRHLPMSGGCVLAGRGQRAAAVGAAGHSGGRDAGERFDIAESELREVGQLKAAYARDVAQGVAARVAVLRSIRHLTDSHAIEDDPDYAPEHNNSSVARG